jgi:hypothetical protein
VSTLSTAVFERGASGAAGEKNSPVADCPYVTFRLSPARTRLGRLSYRTRGSGRAWRGGRSRRWGSSPTSGRVVSSGAEWSRRGRAATRP